LNRTPSEWPSQAVFRGGPMLRFAAPPQVPSTYAPGPAARPGSTAMNPPTTPPQAVGLYDPRFEHDACGVGMVARLDNQPTHEVVARAITALENLEHRGAAGADARTGDGAGILVQMPDEFLRASVDFELPARGRY